ncbi:MAG: protein-disulfide reductase DsbD family protein, partial [Opitutales bacterium]|nr:protein-disulfide reductase DsbD family protein [Opitutales bacterium]
RTLTSHTSVAPGLEFQVAVSFQIENDWHISGNEKGESYLPTTIKWKLPKGASVKDVQWPKPLSHKQGDLVIPTYEGTITTLATIVAPRDAMPNKNLKLAAEVRWQVCRETLCKTGRAKIKTRVAVGPSVARESTAVNAQ